MKYKVRALDTYEELDLKDVELGIKPKKGDEFYVNKVRLDILLGNNDYNRAFVELVEEETKKEEKPKKNKGK